MAVSEQLPAPSAAPFASGRRHWSPKARFAALIGLVGAEIVLLSLCFSLDFVFGASGMAAAILSLLANALPISMIMAAALLGVGLARPGALTPLFDGAANDRRGPWAILGHLTGFAAFAGVLVATQYGGVALSHATILAALFCSALLSGLCFLRLIAPISAWFIFVRAEAPLLIAASAAALAAVIIGVAAQDYWRPLSDATLELSRLFLSLVTDSVIYDPEARLIGMGDFRVLIAQQCSGYEGVALVLSFMAFFGYVFRTELRFPHFLLLAPIGVAVIWLSNSFRIAALVVVGAEVSSPLAAGGFHSFAGLALFLLVTIAMALTALRTPFFRRDGQAPKPAVMEADPHRAERIQMADALLLPFLVFLLSGVVLAMTFELPARLYVLRVLAVGATACLFLSIYRRMDWRVSAESVLIGLAVAALWILVAPAQATPETTALVKWLKDGPAFDEALWLVARAVGFILLVPLVEELAFRGYLHRVIAHGSIENAPEAAFSWRAFLISSLLFGALHGRWWEGAIAGALFALAMYRSGRLSNAVIAHAVANGAIFAYVLATGHWAAL